MTARQAIAEANAARLRLSSYQLSRLAHVITIAAMTGDHDAINYLWLLNWTPQQLRN